MKIVLIVAAALPFLVLAGWLQRRTSASLVPPSVPRVPRGPPQPVHAGAFLRSLNLPTDRPPPLKSMDVDVRVLPTVAVQVAGGQPAFRELLDVLLTHAAGGGRRAARRVSVSWSPVEEGGLLIVEDDGPGDDEPSEHLAFAHTIVNRSRGRLEVASDRRGTQVAVWLPPAMR